MKHTTPDALLSRALLRFVRDTNPTVAEFVARFGEQVFHVLRKAEVIVVEGGRVRLSRRHLSPDGLFFWGTRVYALERDEVLSVRYSPEGPPVFADVP